MAAQKKTVEQLSQDLQTIHERAINIERREIFLNSTIDDSNSDVSGDGTISHKTTSFFIKNIFFLDNISHTEITVYMNLSYGGDWEAGIGIFDSIELVKSKVKMVVFGAASSMSSVILQAADKRILTKNSYLMLHYGTIAIDNNSQGASEAIKFNDRQCKEMVEIYAKRAVNGKFFKDKGYDFKKTTEYIDGEMRKKSDWYIDCHQAIFLGLADSIIGENGVRI